MKTDPVPKPTESLEDNCVTDCARYAAGGWMEIERGELVTYWYEIPPIPDRKEKNGPHI